MSGLKILREEIKKIASPEKAKASSWFFKTGKGQYGEGDVFSGLTVPEMRIVAKQYYDLPISDVILLLHSKIHEERLIALFIMIHRFSTGDEIDRKEIYDLYITNTQFVNNWDLVDSSAHKIMGEYLLDKKRDILYTFAHSKNIWERRIAIIATFACIAKGETHDSLAIAEILLKDKEDLIQKAVGWVLREIGKRVSREILVSFLQKHYEVMPRTMLRYAIEHFPPEKRNAYLQGKI